jgi:hypothetical protein
MNGLNIAPTRIGMSEQKQARARRGSETPKTKHQGPEKLQRPSFKAPELSD